MTKIKAFKDKDFFKLVEQINRFTKENSGIATQIYPATPWSEYFYGAVWFNDYAKQIVEQKKEQPKQSIRKPTDKQIYFLNKNNKKIPETFEEANQLIKLIKEGKL